jgi:hypothetical protein
MSMFRNQMPSKFDRTICRPFSIPNPLGRWNSDAAQYSNPPSLRAAGFEDDDEDEDENEAPPTPLPHRFPETACKQARNIESPARVDCDPPLSPPPMGYERRRTSLGP